jgi:hypothetical protein
MPGGFHWPDTESDSNFKCCFPGLELESWAEGHQEASAWYPEGREDRGCGCEPHRSCMITYTRDHGVIHIDQSNMVATSYM